MGVPLQRHLSLFLCLCLIRVVSPAQTAGKRLIPLDKAERDAFEKQEKVAILVGVGTYPGYSGLGTLRYPAADVDALSAILRKQHYTVRGDGSQRCEDSAGSRDLCHNADRWRPSERQ